MPDDLDIQPSDSDVLRLIQLTGSAIDIGVVGALFGGKNGALVGAGIGALAALISPRLGLVLSAPSVVLAESVLGTERVAAPFIWIVAASSEM